MYIHLNEIIDIVFNYAAIKSYNFQSLEILHTLKF